MKRYAILFGIIAMTACTPRPSLSITAITVTASQVALRGGDSSQLQGVLFGDGAFDPSIVWSLEPSGFGSLSSGAGNSVLYTAPFISTGRVVRITARSVAADKRQQTVFLSINPRQASIAAGGAHSLALKSDGTILSWGWDADGQLGDNIALEPKATPVAVNPASGIVAIAAGGNHSLALKSDGTVLAWGRDNAGQLGNDLALEDKPKPVSVSGLTNIIAISAGYAHSLALKSNGTVYAWGDDADGQLGDDPVLLEQPVPVLVSGVNNVVAIAAGGSHSLALKSDGTVLAWGNDASGQLGNDAAFGNKRTAEAVSDATGIVAVSAGASHSLALKSDGTLLSWGSDENGELGNDPALAKQPTPVVVRGSSGIIAMAGGRGHSIALKSDGTMLAWGNDQYGQLGDDTALDSQATPKAVAVAEGVVAIAAGNRHSLALKQNGTMLAWGADLNGELGNDAALENESVPVSVLLGANLIRVP